MVIANSLLLYIERVYGRNCPISKVNVVMHLWYLVSFWGSSVIRIVWFANTLSYRNVLLNGIKIHV